MQLLTANGRREEFQAVPAAAAALDRDTAAASYRPDIDGLRAVAILSVLAFHAFPAHLHGGFVGVDVFFVISGFLITGLILKAQIGDGFSFIDFYARRVRRIFPALIAVLLCVWGLGWLKLLPDEYTSLTKHIAAGSAYVSNVLLYKESGYFDTAAEFKPLLHLWSLGVEEQFYIVWPLVLALTWRRPAFQLPAMLALTCLSFIFGLVVVASHPAAAFYLPQARLWELGSGGILAYARLLPAGTIGTFMQRDWDMRARNAAAATGLGLLCVSTTLISPTHAFPGLWALLPVSGALLLIAAGPGAWINRHLLASSLMVFVGLISYPLYLWHWPLLSMAHIIYPDGAAAGVVAGALAAAFLLAILTYHFIELPLRGLGSLPRNAAALFTCLAAVGAVAYIGFLHRWAPLSASYLTRQMTGARAEVAYPGPSLKPMDGFLIHPAAPQRVMFLGDSNIEQYYPRIAELLTRDPKRSRTAIFATGGGCPPIPGVHEEHHHYCEGLVERAVAYASNPAVDTIVIAAAWRSYFYEDDPRYSYYFQDDHFKGHLAPRKIAMWRALQAFDQMVGTLVRQHKRVFIVLQIPVGTGLDPRRMIQRGIGSFAFNVVASPLRRSDVDNEVGPIDLELVEVAKRRGATVIDPLDALCNHEECPTVALDGNPIYRDGGHLRPSYVRTNVRYLDEIVRVYELNADPLIPALN